MKKTRRDFLKEASIAAAALAIPQRGVLLATPSVSLQQGVDPFFREVCILALDAARASNAAYADVRIVNRRTQYIEANNDQLNEPAETETLGIGIRALVDGAWGFASSNSVTRQAGRRVAEEAVARARANSRTVVRPVELAPVDAYPGGTWTSPIRSNPFEVPVAEKSELLLDANNAAMSAQSVRSVKSFLSFVRTEKILASTEGTIISQTVFQTWPSLTVTAGSDDGSSTASRSTGEVAPMGLGYEHVASANLAERAIEAAHEAVEGLSARSVEPGIYDLVLDRTHLYRTIHETLGKATELDRALGLTDPDSRPAFLSNPAEVIGSLRLGPEFMNVLCDRTQRGGLATVGWDDEGVPQDSWPIVRDGVFVDYQTTRDLVAPIADLTGTRYSHGCAASESWNRIQLPRMPNVSLLPSEEDYVVDDLIAATERGIYIKGTGAVSVDLARDVFQFGGDACYEIQGGRIVGRVKDVAYRDTIVEFWNSMDMLGGSRGYALGGLIDDMKGDPAQAHAASHGCPPARFSRRTVFNTAR